jgi:hypothetical protein
MEIKLKILQIKIIKIKIYYIYMTRLPWWGAVLLSLVPAIIAAVYSAFSQQSIIFSIGIFAVVLIVLYSSGAVEHFTNNQNSEHYNY